MNFFQILNYLPNRQSNDENAALDLVNFIQLILNKLSLDGRLIDIHDGLLLLHGQSTIRPKSSFKKKG